MNWLFLESLSLGNQYSDTSLYGGDMSGLAGPMMGAMIGIMAVYLLIFLGLYIYFSLAYAGIGRKAKLGHPDIAWLPFFFGPLAVIYETAKAHWWPFLVGTIGYFAGYLLLMHGMFSSIFGGMSASLILGIIILILTGILFLVMFIIWHWKTYTAVGRPGWWILIPFLASILGFILALAVPILGIIIMILGGISHLVFIGIAAWGR